MVCEYVKSVAKEGWFMQVMECAPETRWYQPIQNCIIKSPTTPSTTQEPTEEVKVTTIIDGHVVRICKIAYFPHPTDKRKFVVCEYIGTNVSCMIHVMECAPGTRWHQLTQNCIADK